MRLLAWLRSIPPIWIVLPPLALVILAVPFPFLGGQQTERHYRVEAARFDYSPGVLRANPGDRVTIELVATDVVHGLEIDGYGVGAPDLLTLSLAWILFELLQVLPLQQEILLQFQLQLLTISTQILKGLKNIDFLNLSFFGSFRCLLLLKYYVLFDNLWCLSFGLQKVLQLHLHC